MNRFKQITFIIGLLVSSFSFSQGTDCADMGPICTDAGLNFTAQSGVPAASVTDPSNNYGCLSSSPNPTWYYLEISQNGDLVMSLSAPSDIDFIIYGPFTDLATAQSACGTMGTVSAPIVDCSYSATNNETPEIGANSTGGSTTAITGEVYVMLITNYANTVQDIVLSQTSGGAATNCLIVDPCVSNPGTFVIKKNNIATALDLYLCEGDIFSITSNIDYTLPSDTIASPVGDGIYTAQLMWLVYNAVPISNDPLTDPGFLGFNSMIPNDDLSGGNSVGDPLFQALGGMCGTYYFVPVAGDDGVGDGGANDNGNLHWDKDNNGCFLFGDPIPVTFACPMVLTPSINCNTLNNGMDIQITGGNGNYNVVNQGAGNLVSGNVVNGGTAQVSDLTNNQQWEIDVTDASGCDATLNGIFAAPTIADITITPAASCPLGADGNASVTLGATGQAPYVVTMNTIATAGTPYVFAAPAGTAVITLVTDDLGCVFDSTVTVTSSDHYIATTQSSTDESCFGDNNGSATITAVGVDLNGQPDGSSIVSIEWIDPVGATIGNTNANHLTQNNMATGNWLVTITDDTGCDVTISIVIGGPQDLGLTVSDYSDITCFDGSDGDITIASNGGTGNVVYSWNTNNPVDPNNQNGTTTNNAIVGTYWAYVTDGNQCVDSVSITLVQPDEITAWITIKDVLCYGDSTGAIIIDSVTNNAGNVDYLWNLVTFPNPATTSNIANGLPVGTYEFKVKDENQCENQYVVTINQNDSIYWDDLGFDSTICRNQIPFDNGNGQVYASASRWAPGVGGGNFTYLWTENSTGLTTTNTTWGNRNPGYYTIIATDDYGCTLTETIYVDSLSPQSSFEIEYALGEPQCVGPAVEVVNFINNSTNYAFSQDVNADTTFVWEFSIEGDTTVIISHATDEIVNYPYSSEGLYSVCLTVIENLNGCEHLTCQEIQIYDCPNLVIPNVFTPDGDDINDVFFFPNVAVIEFECTVYDRWGNEMFVFPNIETTWDGTNKNGKPCSNGVYFYKYKGKSSNGTEYEGQGNIHLLRGK